MPISVTKVLGTPANDFEIDGMSKLSYLHTWLAVEMCRSYQNMSPSMCTIVFKQLRFSWWIYDTLEFSEQPMDTVYLTV